MNNVDRYRSLHESFNRRDWTAFAKKFAPNAEYTDQSRGTVLKGPQEVIDYLTENWVSAFSDAAITEASYIDAGDRVVAHFTGTGLNDGAFGPMPRTIRRVSTPVCEIMQFNEEGQIVSGSLYYNLVTILVQLGHMETPPPSSPS